ncbi:MAG: 30S ribosomal protein S20 [Planctomycetes bacterium]|nr:30S ribosomal protein S20 [Planctomycetota bacterium]
MAHSLSAKKRIRQNAKRNVINRARKSMVKTQMKHFLTALDAGDSTQAAEQYQILSRKLDKVASTSTMHKNTAARIKSRMAKRLNDMAAK